MSSSVSNMSSRVSKMALAGAFAASAAFGQTMAPEQAPVKRPDGSIVYPATAGSAESAPEPAAAMRPDGTVVRPNAAGITADGIGSGAGRGDPMARSFSPRCRSQRAPSISTGTAGPTSANGRGSRRSRPREERIDQSRREREARDLEPRASDRALATLPRSAPTPERAVLGELVDVARHALRFARQELLHRVGELRDARASAPTTSASGRNPRASLCSPWAPPSNARMPRSMQNSSAW